MKQKLEKHKFGMKHLNYVKCAIFLVLTVFTWVVTKARLTHSLSNISQYILTKNCAIIHNVLFDCSLSRDKCVALFQWHSQAALSIAQEKTNQITKYLLPQFNIYSSCFFNLTKFPNPFKLS